jgi:cytochrome b561
MQILSTSDRYGAVAKLLHWLTAIFVVLAWASGEFDGLFGRGQPKAMVMSFHASVGVLILATLVLRLAWRTVDSAPAHLVTPLGQWADRAGRLMHYALLVLLAAIPLTGIVLQFARGRPLPLFAFYEIASPWIADRAFAKSVKSVHELLAITLLVLAGFHALAALAHNWVFQDRTLVRMLPGRHA